MGHHRRRRRLSIGGNHLIHALRRNVNFKILLFNNRIYGLTKGQYSPTSEVGKRQPSRRRSAPIDNPVQPADGGARRQGRASWPAPTTLDTQAHAWPSFKRRRGAHQGAAFVEIYQNCNVFNDLAFIQVTAKDVRKDRQLTLENGKPLVFGKDMDRGIRMNSAGSPEVVDVGDGPGQVPLSEMPLHDETRPSSYAFTLAQLAYPNFPVPMGVLRAVETPTYGALVRDQAEAARQRAKATDLESLWNMGDTWENQGEDAAQ